MRWLRNLVGPWPLLSRDLLKSCFGIQNEMSFQYPIHVLVILNFCWATMFSSFLGALATHHLLVLVGWNYVVCSPFTWKLYPLVNEHSYGKSIFNAKAHYNLPSAATSVYQRVVDPVIKPPRFGMIYGWHETWDPDTPAALRVGFDYCIICSGCNFGPFKRPGWGSGWITIAA